MRRKSDDSQSRSLLGWIGGYISGGNTSPTHKSASRSSQSESAKPATDIQTQTPSREERVQSAYSQMYAEKARALNSKNALEQSGIIPPAVSKSLNK